MAGQKKPATLKSFRESLPAVKLTGDTKLDENDKRCCICGADFAIDDVFTYLPCGHHFHRGDEASVSEDCQGILYWLKDNNECCICRAKLQEEKMVEKKDDKVETFRQMLHPARVDFSSQWACPGCDRWVRIYLFQSFIFTFL